MQITVERVNLHYDSFFFLFSLLKYISLVNSSGTSPHSEDGSQDKLDCFCTYICHARPQKGHTFAILTKLHNFATKTTFLIPFPSPRKRVISCSLSSCIDRLVAGCLNATVTVPRAF